MTKSFRYRAGNSLRKLWLQLLDLLEERTLLAFALILTTIIGFTAVIFSVIEKNNQHPIWRSVVYVMSGMDVDPPETALGQFTATLVLLSGVILVSLLTGYLAAEFSNLLQSSRVIPPKPIKRIFEDHIVIFGWSAKTKAILRELNESYKFSRAVGREIVIVSNDEFLSKGSESIYKHVWHVRGSQADSSSLLLADVSASRGNGAKVAAILSDNTLTAEEADRKSLLTVLAVEHSFPAVHSISEVQLATNSRHFQNANVNELVLPNHFTNLLLARTLEYPGTAAYIEELLALAPPEESEAQAAHPISLFTLSAKEAGVSGKTLPEAVFNFFSQQGGIIVGVLADDEVRFVPDLQESLTPLNDNIRLIAVLRPIKKSL